MAQTRNYTIGKGSRGNWLIVTGIQDIDRRLKTLPMRVQKKVMKQGMRRGLKIIKADIEATAPRETGLMAGNVKVRVLKSRKRDRFALEVRISGKTAGLKVTTTAGKTVFYPAVVEYGHHGVAPNPFMRRSFDREGPVARQVTIQAIREGVEIEASKP
jgi:HK97 gp10 family phage protein